MSDVVSSCAADAPPQTLLLTPICLSEHLLDILWTQGVKGPFRGDADLQVPAVGITTSPDPRPISDIGLESRLIHKMVMVFYWLHKSILFVGEYEICVGGTWPARLLSGWTSLLYNKYQSL